MKDIMVDLETMGNGSDAAIVSIGACFFDITTGETGAEFYYAVDLESSNKYGRMDPSTIGWWLNQSNEARAVFNSPDKVTLPVALDFFYEWISQIEMPYQRTVWGNGASFDNVILRNAFNSYAGPDHEPAWPFYCDRDVRTIVDLGRRLFNYDPKKEMPFDGVQHNAIDDAKHQAKYVSAIYQKLAA